MADRNLRRPLLTLSTSFTSSDDEQIPLVQDFENQSPDSVKSYLSPYSVTEAIDQVEEFGDLQNWKTDENHRPAMSRSFSVPSKLQMTTIADEASPKDTTETTATTTRHSRSSVKHLTCFWWKEKGLCRFADEDCLYAHRDTGHYTDPPRQLVPGEPALAGRKLDRAMRSLAIAQRSSPAMSSLPGTRHGSRASTPGLDYSSPLSSPLQMYHPQADFARLSSDNHFLKNLVDQNAKEKAVMISHIEDLKAENKGMKAELEGLRNAQDQLLAQREGLQARIHQLENEAAAAGRGYNSPYGAIGVYGRARMNSETRFLGGLLDD